MLKELLGSSFRLSAKMGLIMRSISSKTCVSLYRHLLLHSPLGELELLLPEMGFISTSDECTSEYSR